MPKTIDSERPLRSWLTTLFLAAGGVAMTVQAVAGAAATPAPARPQPVALRGRVVFLEQEMHRLYQTELPGDRPHLYGFKTESGDYYTLLRTHLSAALFEDPRLQQETLILKGRVLPRSRLLDVFSICSVHDGKIYDVYYFCSVCNIKTVAPGPCMCCQQPVHLVEKPIGPDPEAQAKLKKKIGALPPEK